MLKIIYFGTPEFSAEILKKIKENCKDIEIVAVFTRPDKPRDRGEVTPSPVKLMAEKLGLFVYTPKSLREEESKNVVINLAADLLVVTAYGLFLPDEILESTKFGATNFHPSLLPKYRGASPVPSAISNGEEVTGVSIIKLVSEMDAGDIISQKEVEILENDTGDSLTDRLANIGAELLVEIINRVSAGDLSQFNNAKPQNINEITITKKLEKEDGKINWNESDELIERKIRAYYPWPGTFSTLSEIAKRFGKDSKGKNEGTLVKVIKAHLDKYKKLRLDEVQLEGKNPISAEEFSRGYLKDN